MELVSQAIKSLMGEIEGKLLLRDLSSYFNHIRRIELGRIKLLFISRKITIYLLKVAIKSISATQIHANNIIVDRISIRHCRSEQSMKLDNFRDEQLRHIVNISCFLETYEVSHLLEN